MIQTNLIIRLFLDAAVYSFETGDANMPCGNTRDSNRKAIVRSNRSIEFYCS
jgi:hypothetical protein